MVSGVTAGGSADATPETSEPRTFDRDDGEDEGKVANIVLGDETGWVRVALWDDRADDVEAAFTHASPAIKRLFGTPSNFGRMVRQGYPMVWRPAEVTFLGLEPRGETMIQTVMIRDQQGALHTLAYQMIPTRAGWQINGVRIMRALGA